MGFPKRFLHDQEEIILERKPHLWSLSPMFGALVLGALAALVITQKVNPGSGNVNGWITWACFVGFIVVLALALWKYLNWSATSFVLTTDRLITRQGVLAKSGREIPLGRINDISFNQSVFERMIGAGDLLIESGGEMGQERFSNVKRPIEVQNEIYTQIERDKGRDADRAGGRRDLSIPEQIDKLDDLRQRGVITQAEFDAKKSQLLDKL